LYDAFGWKTPEYCHLPMVMGEDGQKLSKRHGSTSLVEFRCGGYLPEAIINYVSLLGWSYDDSRQIFSRSDLEKLFTPDKLNKAAAVFDYRKLEWFNGHYIRECADADLAKRLVPFLQKENVLAAQVSPEEEETLLRSIPIIKERLRFLSDAAGLLRFIFKDVPDYTAEDLLPKKTNADGALRFLEEAKSLVAVFFEKTDEENEGAFRALSEKLGTRLGNVLGPLRVAVTGSKVSPPLFESIRLVGKERTLARIEKAIGILSRAV
jgi:glutamyl-tRNA synthetase